MKVRVCRTHHPDWEEMTGIPIGTDITSNFTCFANIDPTFRELVNIKTHKEFIFEMRSGGRWDGEKWEWRRGGRGNWGLYVK